MCVNFSENTIGLYQQIQLTSGSAVFKLWPRDRQTDRQTGREGGKKGGWEEGREGTRQAGIVKVSGTYINLSSRQQTYV